jgi:dipeptidyl aminopeptidase/acylaminoacyl peptidase
MAMLAMPPPVIAADEFLTEGRDIAVDVRPSDGRIVVDLAGDIWTLDNGGGEARLLEDGEQTLQRPKWSPDGQSVLFVSRSSAGGTLRIRNLDDESSYPVGDTDVHNQDAAWHPGGERIVYVSDRHGTGLDIWETDLQTGLSWRLTSDPGDELSPAWSGNGRHLAWIRHDDDGYAIMLRLHGEPDREFLASESPISSLSWRPDGSLLTYLLHGPEGTTLEMAILSDPVLVRTIDAGQEFVDAPVAWPDRMNLYYTANGRIRTRGFEDRVSRPVHFRAMVAPVAPPPPPKPVPQRELVVSNAPDSRLIVRTSRLFDGIWQGYRRDMDVVIDGGRIEAIEARREREDGFVLDLGEVTAIPGLIDAAMPISAFSSTGASILAYGVTTIAVDELADEFDPLAWETEATPGPRVIVLPPGQTPSEISGLADGGLDHIGLVTESRQARSLGHTTRPARRFAAMQDVADVAATIVAASEPNHMPPGAGLQAELLALRRAGLNGQQALHAAGRNAARALGVENQVGTLVPGALADLVLLNGDPLANAGDTLAIVAVVRNGRFYSLVSLLERASGEQNVD